MTMSYFTLSEKNLQLLNSGRQIVSNKDNTPKPKGNHHVPHSEATRKAISNKMKSNNKLLRQILSKPQLSEERVREITRGVLNEFLRKNVAPTNNTSKPINICL